MVPQLQDRGVLRVKMGTVRNGLVQGSPSWDPGIPLFWAWLEPINSLILAWPRLVPRPFPQSPTLPIMASDWLVGSLVQLEGILEASH